MRTLAWLTWSQVGRPRRRSKLAAYQIEGLSFLQPRSPACDLVELGSSKLKTQDQAPAPAEAVGGLRQSPGNHQLWFSIDLAGWKKKALYVGTCIKT